MTKPQVIFGDPEGALVDYYRDVLVGRGEAYVPAADANVHTGFPSTTLAAGQFHVQVDLELGDATGYPITERAQVRVTCHGPRTDRPGVKNLASLAQALAYSHPGDESVAGVTINPTGRSGVSADPSTKNLMVWFLVTVVLKPTALVTP